MRNKFYIIVKKKFTICGIITLWDFIPCCSILFWNLIYCLMILRKWLFCFSTCHSPSSCQCDVLPPSPSEAAWRTRHDGGTAKGEGQEGGLMPIQPHHTDSTCQSTEAAQPACYLTKVCGYIVRRGKHGNFFSSLWLSSCWSHKNSWKFNEVFFHCWMLVRLLEIDVLSLVYI